MPGFDWKKWFIYSKRFWLLAAPLGAELVVRLGGAVHMIPEGLEEDVRNSTVQIILRAIEAVGAWIALKGGPPVTVSYEKSGGVPEAPFSK